LEPWEFENYTDPTYRKIQKQLWRAKNGFSVEQTRDGKHVWQQAKVGTDAGREPFVVDLKSLGQHMIGRHRNERKELSPRRFDAMIKADNYRNEFMLTNSIRSGRSIEAQLEQLKVLSTSADAFTWASVLADQEHQPNLRDVFSESKPANTTLTTVPSLGNFNQSFDTPAERSLGVEALHGASLGGSAQASSENLHKRAPPFAEKSPILRVEELTFKAHDTDPRGPGGRRLSDELAVEAGQEPGPRAGRENLLDGRTLVGQPRRYQVASANKQLPLFQGPRPALPVTDNEQAAKLYELAKANPNVTVNPANTKYAFGRQSMNAKYQDIGERQVGDQ
jgi:hypothetical protein